MFRLAVLGDPIAHSRSPDLHRAGLAALGIEGGSEALRTPAAELGVRLRELASRGYAGVNLTHPLKEAALEHLARIAGPALAARSVNTVGFAAGGAWGDTTDGGGFVDLLRSLGREPARERVLVFGSGGAARSLAHALAAAGCGALAIVSRDPARASAAWAGLAPARLLAAPEAEGSEALASATVVVNATPGSGPVRPADPARAARAALLVDLTYGPEPPAWVTAARAAGREAVDGLGLLVHQARRSLALWTGRDVPLEPLARAVGWPR